MGDDFSDFGNAGLADNSVPTSNNPPNRVSDFNLQQGGFLGQLDGAGVPGNGRPFLYRGFITTPYLNDDGSNNTGKIYTFNFHYNPTEIGFSYDFNTSSILSPEQQGPNGVALLVGGASIAFTVRLDRTLDMASTPQGPDSPGSLGVMHDLRVLQKMVGSLDNDKSSNTNGQILSREVLVVFSNTLGNPVFNEATLTSTGLNFRGFITGLQVTFTQFNYLMIPSRADIDIQMQKVFDPASTNNELTAPTDANKPKAAAAPKAAPATPKTFKANGRTYQPKSADGSGGTGFGGGNFG